MADTVQDVSFLVHSMRVRCSRPSRTADQAEAMMDPLTRSSFDLSVRLSVPGQAFGPINNLAVR